MKYKFVTLDGREIVFRTLSADEADRLYSSLKRKDVGLEEYIFNRITDDKYKVEELEAGIIPTVIFLSFKRSGVFKDPLDFPDTIEKARESISKNAYYLLYGAIIKANSGKYSLEELKKMSINEIIELYALSEMILGANVIDTKKARQVIEEELAAKSSAPVKKGIKAFTEEELNILLNALDREEVDGGM